MNEMQFTLNGEGDVEGLIQYLPLNWRRAKQEGAGLSLDKPKRRHILSMQY